MRFDRSATPGLRRLRRRHRRVKAAAAEAPSDTAAAAGGVGGTCLWCGHAAPPACQCLPRRRHAAPARPRTRGRRGTFARRSAAARSRPHDEQERSVQVGTLAAFPGRSLAAPTAVGRRRRRLHRPAPEHFLYCCQHRLRATLPGAKFSRAHCPRRHPPPTRLIMSRCAALATGSRCLHRLYRMPSSSCSCSLLSSSAAAAALGLLRREPPASAAARPRAYTGGARRSRASSSASAHRRRRPPPAARPPPPTRPCRRRLQRLLRRHHLLVEQPRGADVEASVAGWSAAAASEAASIGGGGGAAGAVLAAADDADVDADVDAVSDAASSGAAGATVSEAHASSHLMPRSAGSVASASTCGLRSRSTSLGARTARSGRRRRADRDRRHSSVRRRVVRCDNSAGDLVRGLGVPSGFSRAECCFCFCTHTHSLDSHNVPLRLILSGTPRLRS